MAVYIPGETYWSEVKDMTEEILDGIEPHTEGNWLWSQTYWTDVWKLSDPNYTDANLSRLETRFLWATDRNHVLGLRRGGVRSGSIAVKQLVFNPAEEGLSTRMCTLAPEANALDVMRMVASDMRNLHLQQPIEEDYSLLFDTLQARHMQRS